LGVSVVVCGDGGVLFVALRFPLELFRWGFASYRTFCRVLAQLRPWVRAFLLFGRLSETRFPSRAPRNSGDLCFPLFFDRSQPYRSARMRFQHVSLPFRGRQPPVATGTNGPHMPTVVQVEEEEEDDHPTLPPVAEKEQHNEAST
jgi:hypothetical protein